MPTPIIIQVVSSSNGTMSPEPSAEVVVGRRDLVGDTPYPYTNLAPTFQHASAGRYVNSTGDASNEPGEGQWLIVVRKKGSSTVAQKLTFVASNGVLKAIPGWDEPGREKVAAATVSIVNFDEARGAQPKAQQSLITVQLFPSQRYVGMGCLDHRGTGTRFVLFALGRRDELFDCGQLNLGAVALIFDCLRNETLVTVKSAKAASNAWQVVSRQASDRPLSITDFYQGLHDIGSSDPNTVVEAGNFGHAWHQGPIVQDTYDRSPDLSVRDAADTDGRPKDWYPDGAVAKVFANLPKAFAAQARMIVWGCSHMVNVSAEAAEANKQAASGAARSKFFLVALNNGHVNTTLDFSKRNIAQYVLSTSRGTFMEIGDGKGQATYGGRMAQALNGAAECFVATPGMGANFGKVSGPLRKGIPQVSHDSMHIVDQGENLQLRNFFNREYGSAYQRDSHLYMNYSKFSNVSLPTPPWATQRFCIYFHDDFRQFFLRLPSAMEVTRKTGNFDDPIAFQQGSESGHLYVARAAVPAEVQLRNGAKTLILSAGSTDVGLFVTQTGKTLLLERTGRGAFGAPSRLPTLFDLQLEYDPKWIHSPNDSGAASTSNLLEQVPPLWVW